jgi:hypothetical protein
MYLSSRVFSFCCGICSVLGQKLLLPSALDAMAECAIHMGKMKANILETGLKWNVKTLNVDGGVSMSANKGGKLHGFGVRYPWCERRRTSIVWR